VSRPKRSRYKPPKQVEQKQFYFKGKLVRIKGNHDGCYHDGARGVVTWISNGYANVVLPCLCTRQMQLHEVEISAMQWKFTTSCPKRPKRPKIVKLQPKKKVFKLKRKVQ